MADCRRKNGSRGRTALRDVDRCVGDIGNLDGQLVCNRADQSVVKNAEPSVFRPQTFWNVETLALAH